jgi:hypothetical protein
MLTLCCTAVVVAAGPAGASSATAMGVQVDNAQVTRTGASGDTCSWQVSSEVSVVNRTAGSRNVSSVSANVFWTAPDGTSGAVRGVRITDNGGLEPGVQLGPNEDRTFSPFVTQFDIPCTADFGDLAAVITTTAAGGGDAQTNSGDAPFLENGTAVPVGALGALGIAALFGTALVIRQRRRVAPSPA